MTPRTSVPGLSPVRVVLANGVRLLAQHNPTTPTVAINATFFTGSIYEPPTLGGLAYIAALGPAHDLDDALVGKRDLRGEHPGHVVGLVIEAPEGPAVARLDVRARHVLRLRDGAKESGGKK